MKFVQLAAAAAVVGSGSLVSGAQVESSSASVSRTPRTYSTINPKASDIAKAASNATTNHFTSSVKGAAFDRMVVIWLENTDYDKAAGQEDMQWLASQGILLDNYWGVTHPSEPNYVASVGGDYFALDDDRFIALPANVSTVVDLLDSKSISWGEYEEHMPYSGFQGFNYSNQETFANDYVRKHNPLIIFDSVAQNQTRLGNIKNFTMFEKDLADKTLPQFFHITPNMTNDGHDSTIKVAANWSRSFLTPLLQNEYFTNNTLIVLTFDENDTYSIKNKVFTILLGGAVPEELKGTTDSTFYDQYSLISTPEANWDLPSLGRNDVNANVFQFVANKTNVTNRNVDTTYMVNNATYVGYLLDDTIPLPAPNVTAINMNGKPVLKAIVDKWGAEYSAQLSQSYFTSTTTTVSGSISEAPTTIKSASATITSASATTSGSTAAKNSTSSNGTRVSTKSSSGGAAAIAVLPVSGLLGLIVAYLL
ncbi:hypothetical protein HG536_0A01890 [Torulaspora globosa]|uniref:acid phosphatase n=1 Tax=Torulaspora globosa TaxID=48254 RepID=A0A7G3ZA36_9SACH|nr:uncharacterized protein HG536_0A01890 [Torulaspora globosa]QLL30372.1 hypothetical protein HG536_0A01890 [Torulaspora globosa]